MRVGLRRRRQTTGLPVVVGGCYRSGTSALRRMLDCHSRIHCGPEVKFFPDFYSRVNGPWDMLHFLPSARTLVAEDDLLEVIGSGFLELHDRAARAAGKARWADKAPENILYWRQWQLLLGDRWLLIQVLRNPLDTIASIRQAEFVDLPTSIDDQVELYREFLDAGFQFKSEHPLRYCAVLYEELVADPERVLGALMEFLGERFETQQLRFNDQPHQSGLEDPKVAETSEVHRASVHRWPEVLSTAEARTVWNGTADLWRRIDPNGRFVSAPGGGSAPRGLDRAARSS